MLHTLAIGRSGTNLINFKKSSEIVFKNLNQNETRF